MVSAELEFAFKVSSGFPAAFVCIEGHLDIAAPVVETTDDSDRGDWSEFVCHGHKVDIDTIETSIDTRHVRATIVGNTAFAIEFPVAIPVVLVGLELELAIEPVESLILTVAISAVEGMRCTPTALVTNLVDKLRKLRSHGDDGNNERVGSKSYSSCASLAFYNHIGRHCGVERTLNSFFIEHAVGGILQVCNRDITLSIGSQVPVGIFRLDSVATSISELDVVRFGGNAFRQSYGEELHRLAFHAAEVEGCCLSRRNRHGHALRCHGTI